VASRAPVDTMPRNQVLVSISFLFLFSAIDYVYFIAAFRLAKNGVFGEEDGYLGFVTCISRPVDLSTVYQL